MTVEVDASEHDDTANPMFYPPLIFRPTAEDAENGDFTIHARSSSYAFSWRVRIFTSAGKIKEMNVYIPGDLVYRTSISEIPPGTKFYFDVSYRSSFGMSAPARTRDLIMDINPPSFRSTGSVPDRPVVEVWGYPGATVRLYEAGSGAVVHGTGIVGPNSLAKVRVTEKLPVGEFHMTCNQTFNGVQSGWAKTGLFRVQDVKLEIRQPTDGSVVSQKPRVIGVGHPGAIIKLYQAGWGGVVHGSVKVDDTNSGWIIDVTESLPVGEFSMTASETLDGVEYGYSDTRTFSVRASIEDDHSVETE